MTSIESILPGFPDTEQLDELRFHVRSLHYSIAASIAKLAPCLPLPRIEPAPMRRLRHDIEDATATIEHDAQHHVQRALSLVRAISGERESAVAEELPAMTPPISLESALAAGNAHDQLATDLGVVLAALARAQADIDEIARTSVEEAANLRPHVEAAADTLQHTAWPAVLRCLALTEALHRVADPAAAAEEARNEELATPLRELAVEGARALDRCPHCGAPLNSDDRTFEGSYCENCRTRLFEPASRSA